MQYKSVNQKVLFEVIWNCEVLISKEVKLFELHFHVL
jgi:hypothetical protein